MANTGLTVEEEELIKRVFQKYSQVESVKIYGSRAKGSFHSRSDIDLVIFSKNIDRFTISDILLELNELNIPYKIDLQDYSSIKNKKLIEHIDRVGLVFC